MTNGDFYCMTVKSCLENLKNRASANKLADRCTDTSNALDEGTCLFIIRDLNSLTDSQN